MSYTVRVKQRFFWRSFRVSSHYEEAAQGGQVARLVLNLHDGSQRLVGDCYAKEIVFCADFFRMRDEQAEAAAAAAQVREEVRATVEAEVKAEAEEQRNQQLKAMMTAQPPPTELQGIPKFATPQALRRN